MVVISNGSNIVFNYTTKGNSGTSAAANNGHPISTTAPTNGAPSFQTIHRGCQARDHKVKVRSDQETDIFRILMAHRDAVCLGAVRKTAGGLKVSSNTSNMA